MTPLKRQRPNLAGWVPLPMGWPEYPNAATDPAHGWESIPCHGNGSFWRTLRAAFRLFNPVACIRVCICNNQQSRHRATSPPPAWPALGQSLSARHTAVLFWAVLCRAVPCCEVPAVPTVPISGPKLTLRTYRLLKFRSALLMLLVDFSFAFQNSCCPCHCSCYCSSLGLPHPRAGSTGSIGLDFISGDAGKEHCQNCTLTQTANTMAT